MPAPKFTRKNDIKVRAAVVKDKAALGRRHVPDRDAILGSIKEFLSTGR